MAESQRGKLRGRVIKIKLKDSVSVSSGQAGRGGSSRSRSSGGGGRGGSRGITATVQTPAEAPKVAGADNRSRVLRQRAARGAGVQAKSRVSQEDITRDAKEGATGFGESLKEFALGGFQQELKLGSGSVFTSSGKGAIVDPKARELFESIGKEIPEDTFTQKLFEGRISDIDLTDPRTVGQAIGAGALLALPVGGKGIGKVSKGLREASQKQKVGKLEDTLGLKGQSEKLGKDTFITGGGTESRPQSLFITRFKKGGATVEEVKPDSSLLGGRGKAEIFGKLDPTTRKDLGATQIGKDLKVTDPKLGKVEQGFRFETDFGKTGSKGKFVEGITEGQVKPFGKSSETSLENILKKRPERILQDIRKPPKVFAQTKAEKLEPRGLGSGIKKGKASTPFKGGSSVSGSKQTFTETEVKLIKSSATPETKPTQQKGTSGTLLTAPTQSFQIQEQSLKVPPQSQPPKLKADKGGLQNIQVIRGDVTPKVTSKQLDSLIPQAGIRFRDEVKTVLDTPQITAPTEGFKLKDDTTFKLRTPPKEGFKPPEDPLITIPEVPPPPPEPIRVPPPAAFPHVPLSGGGSDPDFSVFKRRKPFVGNTLETQIEGIFNEPEINVGRTRTFKQKKGKKKKRESLVFGSKRGTKVKIF